MKVVNPEQEFFIFDATCVDFKPLADEELEQLKIAKRKYLEKHLKIKYE